MVVVGEGAEGSRVGAGIEVGLGHATRTSMAGVSRVSPVSFLKAKPRAQIFLLVMVLNMRLTMMRVKRFFWYSFMRITWCQ